MDNEHEVETPVQLWAEWRIDRDTLHLTRDLPPSDQLHNVAVCATRNEFGAVISGPHLLMDRVLPLSDWRNRSSVCRDCVTISQRLLVDAVDRLVRARLAYEIRADMVCCDAYDVCRVHALSEHGEPSAHPKYHDVCYWGESVARVVEGRNDEECEHQAGSYFDRVLCPEPCGVMHDRCRSCDEALDACETRSNAYFTSGLRPGGQDRITRFIKSWLHS